MYRLQTQVVTGGISNEQKHGGQYSHTVRLDSHPFRDGITRGFTGLGLFPLRKINVHRGGLR